jgi:hypothetical protein
MPPAIVAWPVLFDGKVAVAEGAWTVVALECVFFFDLSRWIAMNAIATSKMMNAIKTNRTFTCRGA